MDILDIEKVIAIKYHCNVCNSGDFVIMDTFDYYTGDVQYIKCDFCLSSYKLSEEELKRVSEEFEGVKNS